MSVAIGWSVQYKGGDWYILAPDHRRAKRGVLWGALRMGGSRRRTGVGREALLIAQAECDVKEAWAYRVEYSGNQAWLVHGRDSADAASKVSKQFPGLNQGSFKARRVDPILLLLALPEDKLRVIGRSLWGARAQERGVVNLQREISPFACKVVAISCRLAMELDWWAQREHGWVENVNIKEALRVHVDHVPRELLERCIGSGLRVKQRMSWQQRDVLRELAGAYGFEEPKSIPEQTLFQIWDEGPEYEPPNPDRIAPGY